MRRGAVVLDLNGTLVLPLKQERLSELTAVPGAVDAVTRLTNARFRLSGRHRPEQNRERAVLDVRAATVIGARGCLVRTGWAADPQVVAAAAPYAWFVGETLGDIVDRILECDASSA